MADEPPSLEDVVDAVERTRPLPTFELEGYVSPDVTRAILQLLSSRPPKRYYYATLSDPPPTQKLKATGPGCLKKSVSSIAHVLRQFVLSQSLRSSL